MKYVKVKCLSVYLSEYLFVCTLSVRLYLSPCMCYVYMPVFMFVGMYVSVCLSVCLSVCYVVCLYLSFCLSVRLLSVNLSVCLSVFLSVGLCRAGFYIFLVSFDYFLSTLIYLLLLILPFTLYNSHLTSQEYSD